MKKTGLKYRAVYLLGFPLAGAFIGIAVFALLNYVNGPLSKFALYLSVGVWGGVWSVLRNLWILKSKENIKVKES
ncbi:TPA: hypothetical protein I7566_13245 [Vibrio cholerae]|uniref:Uncharacterized protein n=3 Tax=Gammaproteobacteria TaxID=1236 RepID=A0A220UTC2_9GAMM|nr:MULTISPECIES: hypothetical protein [Gammaproteobacteria]ASK71437.1 hypothetical protein CF168_21410 [Shewanella bicestrii]EKU5733894.1 hypothetical protein [Proteus mirabilis]EKX9403983.1 hypothetical protein [Klebsiella pneumoniae]AYV08539.1 hypothetical protein EEL44_05735 [Vibrio cholerae]EKF9266469.1 hypothetical protein [Vibrio cholerae]